MQLEFRYGDDNTIHRTNHVDVEVDEYGKVVAVWFRCSLVPFEQVEVDVDRAKDMESAYANHPPGIKAIVFEHR